MTESLTVRHLVLGLSFLGGGIVLGFVVDRLIRRKLRHRATATSWGGDDIIISALHTVTLIWFTALGAYVASRVVPLKASIVEPTHRGLLAVVVASGTLVAARVAADLVRLYAVRTGGGLPSSSIFVHVSRIVVFAVGLLVLLQSLGVSITPLLGALGVGGLAVALALQDTLSNLFAGIHLLASRKIRPGDYVQLDTTEHGYVTDINWRNTSLRQLPNNIVVVPNARMASAIVTNFYQPERELAVLVEVGVSYDSDLEKVERVTIEEARRIMQDVSGGVPEFEPFVRFHTFGESSIDMTVILRAREFTDQYVVKHRFVMALHERFRREGIVIPFPIRTIVQQDKGRAR